MDIELQKCAANLRIIFTAAGLSAFVVGGTLGSATAAPAPSSTSGSTSSTGTHATANMPVFRLIEGEKGSANPYTPAALNIPAGKKVVLEITDHLGGCALVTVFPGLGVNGGTVRARVPVGQTRRIVIRAPKAGRYRYHCSESMYFGEIVAHWPIVGESKIRNY